MKEINEAQRSIDIARSRGVPLRELLHYDLITDSSLFDGDFTTKPAKHIFVTELEIRIKDDEFNFMQNSPSKTSLVIDFMSLIRKFPLKKLLTFEDLFELAWTTIIKTCKFDQVDIIYDSYIEKSVKECERQRRATNDPVEFVNLTRTSSIPVQLDKFWSCCQNKEKLQNLSRQFFVSKSRDGNMKLILSGCVTNNNDVISIVEILEQDKQLTIREDLTNQLEEADVRIIPHIEKAIKNESKRIVVLSNDTDVFALLLHYSHSFFALGMTELWVKYVMGESSRYIPIHIMANKIGPIECSVLFKAHILTGCDVTSKVGTKSAALKANPEMYLLQFGEGDRSRASYDNAEKYLIKVIQPNSKCSSFDELRYNLYLNKKSP